MLSPFVTDQGLILLRDKLDLKIAKKCQLLRWFYLLSLHQERHIYIFYLTFEMSFLNLQEEVPLGRWLALPQH